MASVEMVGRLLVSLAVVLGLMWVIARKLRGGSGGKGRLGRSTKVVEVLDRVSLSRSASVTVVRVNDEAFVLGVAEQGVTILGTTDLTAALAAKTTTKKQARTTVRTTVQIPVSATRPAPAAAAAPTAAASGAAVSAATVSAATVSAAAVSAAAAEAPAARGALAGSALSPQTWRQTIDSLRDLTART